MSDRLLCYKRGHFSDLDRFLGFLLSQETYRKRYLANKDKALSNWTFLTCQYISELKSIANG